MSSLAATTDVPRGEILWQPSAERAAATRIGAYLQWLQRHRGLRVDTYHDLWEWSVEDLPAFWQSVWDHFEVISHAPVSEVLVDRYMPGARWFPGTTLNYAEHALRGQDAEVVIIARSQTRAEVEFTRGELREAVARAAHGLRGLGVQPGDRVVAYMPNIPETVVALLATASVGAVWAGCAPDFGAEAVLDRLQQLEPKVLIAVDGYRYGSREVDRSTTVEAIKAGLPSLEATVHVPYLRAVGAAARDELRWDEFVATPAEPEHVAVPFDHPLWVLFSSGTTGLPKAIVHGHGGVLLELLKSHALQSDLGPGDRYFFFAPTNWVVWNSLVSGLLTGAAIVLLDGDPGYPDGRGLWRTVAETHTTAFGCGATFLMLSRSSGQEPSREFDLSSVRSVTSTGSPLPAAGFRWVYEHVGGDVYLQSTSGGTDVCGAFVGGSPLLPVRAGEIACRCLGVQVDALDEQGRRLIGQLGELVVSEPMPSMPLYFWNDPGNSRYIESYFDEYPGRWRHGDWIMFSDDGSCVVTGRSDATLNRGGVRLGTSDVYAALETVPEVTDSLVVHLEDSAGGLGRLVLFVTVEAGATLDDGLRGRICQVLRTRLSPRHVPDQIHAVPAVPYTVTGKKLEIPVKRMLVGACRTTVTGDGAVRDSSALDWFERFAASGGLDEAES